MSFLRPVLKGWVGEAKTKLTQRIFLDSKEYYSFNNLIIQEESGSTQIDHIVVSKYGVFVIETKNMSGWIFGSERNARWTQVFPNKKKVAFQNPLRQNYRHTMSLSKYLGMNHDKVFSIVVFWGDCKFKTEIPENVVSGGMLGCTKYIKSKSEILLTDDEVTSICDQLQTGKANMNILSGWRHVRSIKKRLRK